MCVAGASPNLVIQLYTILDTVADNDPDLLANRLICASTGSNGMKKEIMPNTIVIGRFLLLPCFTK